jgi:GT2 family glycosyltransferase
MKDLGICILTLKSKEKVLACLDSLFKTTRDLDLDVVVVDNHSQDGTVEEIRAQFPGVRLILNDDNLGYSRSESPGCALLRSA